MKLVNGYQGLVWEVALGSELGFGYVRSMDIPEHYGWYLDILNYRSQTKIKKFDFEQFKSFDELVAPILGINFPSQRGEDRWKPLGYLPISPERLIAPDMKASDGISSEPESLGWFVIRGTSGSDLLTDDNVEPIIFRYNQVMHLGFYGHNNLRWITPRIILEWMKVLNMDYQAYQTQSVPKDFLSNHKFFVSVSTPYTETPLEHRNKLIM